MSTYNLHIFNSYVQYSNIAAKVVRRCLKPELKADAAKREVVSVKFTKWEGGKAVGESTKIFGTVLNPN